HVQVLDCHESSRSDESEIRLVSRHLNHPEHPTPCSYPMAVCHPSNLRRGHLRRKLHPKRDRRLAFPPSSCGVLLMPLSSVPHPFSRAPSFPALSRIAGNATFG